MEEYYGRCPECRSMDVRTIETYEKPVNRRRTETRYICECQDCGSRFDISDDEEIN